MSYQMLREDVLFFQRLLRAEALYGKKLDGIWGRFTEKAAGEFEAQSLATRDKEGAFDLRSENNISSLALRAQKEARKSLARMHRAGIGAKVISGTRTYEEQNRLYRIGRWGNTGKIVTKARGGRSNHNFGVAWDIGIFDAEGQYSQKRIDYRVAAEFAMSEYLEWGGDWDSFPDAPHYQLKVAVPNVEVLREKFEKGETFFV